MLFFDQINSHKYLYLAQISEPEDNRLRLVIEEAGSSGIEEDLVVCGHTFKGTRALVSDERHFAYEILFPDYIAYSVRNESFTREDKDAEFSGKRFCVYTKSAFLDYVARSTFATAEYPGPFAHYGFNCLNHIVDVISRNYPDIKVLRNAIK
jgi:hypothetical protein